MTENQREADKLRRLIRHDAYIMNKQILMLFKAATDDKPAIELDELLADVQESVNSLENRIEALREVE